jgi:hypothetical protein
MRIGRDRIESEEKNRGYMANRPKLNLNLSKKAGLVAIATPVILGITHATELRAQTPGGPEAGDKRYLAGQIVVASGSQWRSAARLQDIEGRRKPVF